MATKTTKQNLKQQTFKSLLIKQLFIAIALGLLIALPLISIPGYLFLNTSINHDIEQVEKISYEAINNHLSTGWQKHNIQNVYLDVRQQMPNAALFLQKAPQYLDDGDDVIDPATPTSAEFLKLIKQVEKDERTIVDTNFVTKTISAAIPIKFKTDCLVCHSVQVANGEIYPGALAGTMVLQVPMSIDSISTTSAVIFFIIFLMLFTIIAAIVTNKLVQNNLLTPLEILANRVKRLRISSHERHIDWQRTPQTLIEIDHIDESISEHINIIRNVYDKLDALVVTEHETGLFHRDRFNEVMRYEMFRAHRYQHPFSLLIIKLEQVRVLNSTAKNLEKEDPGSKYMVFGQILHNDTRETDMSFRLEEHIFAIVAPETGIEGVHKMREDIYRRLISNELPEEEGRQIAQAEYEFTIKVGTATYNSDNETNAKDMLKTAIDSMRDAKPQIGCYPPSLNNK